MINMLLSIDEGTYFSETGEINRNLPIDYVKARTWELRPTVKAPPAENQLN